MVQAMIKIKERTNRVLNIVKAKYGFNDKSSAIDFVTEKYEESFLEPELRPEFVEKINKLEKTGRFQKYDSVDELRKKIENAP